MLQSGHGRRDGRTDGRTDGLTEWNQYTPQQLRCSGGIINIFWAIWVLMAWWFSTRAAVATVLRMHQCISRVMHIYVGNLTITGSDYGLSPGGRQAIIWTNAGILLIWPLGTNFTEIWFEIQKFWCKKIDLKMSSAKWRPYCLGLNVYRVNPKGVLTPTSYVMTEHEASPITWWR